MIYLYVKQHSTTKLKYFGRTTCKDPYKYKGSGKYWQSHLKVYGNQVETTSLWSFNDMETCSQFALEFSKEHNIMESSEWANLANEDGYMGRVSGSKYHLSDEQRQLASQRMIDNNPMKVLRTNKGSFQKGRKVVWTDEQRQKGSNAKKGSLNPNYGKKGLSDRLNVKVTCQGCGKTTNKGNFIRWHQLCNNGK